MKSQVTGIAGKIDIDKLALAVAIAETGDGKTGSAISKSNYFGIMEYKNGRRKLKTYTNKEESYTDFKKIWLENYCDCFPTPYMASRWTGTDGKQWLKNVKTVYYR